MKTVEVMAGLRGLECRIFETRKPEEALFKWASDGLLTAPTFKDEEAEWPPESIERAAALDALIFRYGFGFDTVRAVARICIVRMCERGKAGLLGLFEKGDAVYGGDAGLSEYYLPCVLWLIGFGKAKIGISNYEVDPTSIEAWEENGHLQFRRANLEPPPAGVHPRMVERIVRRTDFSK